MERPSVSLYVDGNALFRAIDDMNEPAFKWLDMWRLGTTLVGDRARLTRVVVAFSVTGEDRSAAQQERAYLRALRATDVECLVEDPVRLFHECSRCGHGWDERQARRNEMDLAVEILNDAWRDAFDEAWLVSDEFAETGLSRKFDQFPDKSLTLVCLRNVPRQLQDTESLRRRTLTKRHLRESSLDERVIGEEGESIARPRAWNPRGSATWSDLQITGL